MSFFRILGAVIQIIITATLFSKWSIFINEFTNRKFINKLQERKTINRKDKTIQYYTNCNIVWSLNRQIFLKVIS